MFAKENIRIISAFIFIVVLLLPVIIVGTCYDIKQTDNLPKIISFINQTLPIDLTYNENNNINDKFHRVEFRLPLINYEKDIVISYASEKENLIYLSATRLPILSLKDFSFHYFKNGNIKFLA